MTVLNPDRPGLQEGVLLRELNHRVTNGVALAIDLVSARGANWSIATRQMKAPRRTRAIASNDAVLTASAAADHHEPAVEAAPLAGLLRQQEREMVVPRQSADALGGLLSPSHHTDAP